MGSAFYFVLKQVQRRLAISGPYLVVIRSDDVKLFFSSASSSSSTKDRPDISAETRPKIDVSSINDNKTCVCG